MPYPTKIQIHAADIVLVYPPGTFPKYGENFYFTQMKSRAIRAPVRQLKHRRWMSDSYYRRVQKKWNRRAANGDAGFDLRPEILYFDFELPIPLADLAREFDSGAGVCKKRLRQKSTEVRSTERAR